MSTEEAVAKEQLEIVLQPVKTGMDSDLQSSRDSGYNGNSTAMEKGLQIVIPFQPLNPILAPKATVLQSSAILESNPQTINISSINGSANDFNSKGLFSLFE